VVCEVVSLFRRNPIAVLCGPTRRCFFSQVIFRLRRPHLLYLFQRRKQNIGTDFVYVSSVCPGNVTVRSNSFLKHKDPSKPSGYFILSFLYFSTSTLHSQCGRGGGVRVGVGRSRVQFLRRSLRFFINLILSAALCPRDRLSL